MEFDEIIVKESPGLCRCCLSEGCYKDLGTEYTWMNDTEVYADMLLECFDIGISQHNEGPNGPNRLICEVCITRLRDACNFKKQVLESEKRFVDMVGRGDFAPKVVVYPAMKPEVVSEEVLAEDAEVEYLEEDLMDYDDKLPMPESPTPETSDDMSLATLKVKNKRGRPRKTATVEKPEKKTKIAKTEDKPRTSKGKNCTVEDKYKKKQMKLKQMAKRKNVEYVLQYGNVTPFLWNRGTFSCFYCNERMKDPDKIREHTTHLHQFANLELTLYDRMKHNRNIDAAVKIDVADISCNICNNPVANLEQLIHHLIISHDIEYDMSVTNCLLPFKLGKEPSCATCDMKFVFFEYLLRHANKYHLSHDYMCDICGTSFQGENHLRMHNRYYHKEGGYNCQYCNQNLATLSKKLLHEKNVHSVNWSSCPHCSETFKSPYFKKLHLANVHGVEEMKIKCPHCTKVFPQVSIMSRHMRRVHLKEKNSECEVCKEKFFGAYDLKLHMIRHNGEKNYICTVCGKKFAKKSNLSSHANIHSQTKGNYICVTCNKGYTSLDSLRVHIRSRHENSGKFDEGIIVKNSYAEGLEGIVDEAVGEDIVQLDFIGDDLEGTEVTGEYVL